MTRSFVHGVLGMASVGCLPKILDFTLLVLFILLALARIVPVHPMAADHELNQMSWSNSGPISPTPTLAARTVALDSVPSETPCCPTWGRSKSYELGAQPRLYPSRERGNQDAMKAAPSLAVVSVDHVLQSRKVSSHRKDDDYISGAEQNRTSRNLIMDDPVTNWAAVTPSSLVIDDIASRWTVSEKRASFLEAISSSVARVKSSNVSTQVRFSGLTSEGVEPTALPEAKVNVVRVVDTEHPLGSGRLAIESSMRSLESKGTLVTPPWIASESKRLLAPTSSPEPVRSVTLSTLVQSSLRVDVVETATVAASAMANSAESVLVQGSTVHNNPMLSSPIYADVQFLDDGGSGSVDGLGETTGNLTIAPTSSSNFTAFSEQTNAKVLMMSTAADMGFGQPSSESQVQTEAPLPAGTVAGIVVASIGFIGILAAGLGLYVIKRFRGLDKKTYNGKFSGDSCSYLDGLQVSYINSHMELPKESSEEMFSLDNDSFLNSLEAMTMENYWAEDRRSTKV